MRNAPSVIHPVGRPVFFGLALAGLALAALAVIVAWALTPVAAERAQPAMLAALTAWGLWSAWAAAAWWRSPEGRLEWRGPAGTDAGGIDGGWFWHGAAPTPGRLHRAPELMLDLQRVALVRLDGRWIWLEARHGAPSWWSLRRALLAAAPA